MPVTSTIGSTAENTQFPAVESVPVHQTNQTSYMRQQPRRLWPVAIILLMAALIGGTFTWYLVNKAGASESIRQVDETEAETPAASTSEVPEECRRSNKADHLTEWYCTAIRPAFEMFIKRIEAQDDEIDRLHQSNHALQQQLSSPMNTLLPIVVALNALGLIVVFLRRRNQ